MPASIDSPAPDGPNVQIQRLGQAVLRYAAVDGADDHQVLLNGGEPVDALVVREGLVILRDETPDFGDAACP